MRKLFSILALVLFYVGITFGQAAVDIPLTVTDNQGGSKVLNVGLDLTATTGIDPALGESDLPPFPPAGVFETRWSLQPFGVGNLSTYKDYRQAPAFPYSGTVTHRLLWQYTDLATQITFTYNLPPEATMVITSNNATPLWTSGTLTGSGSYVLNDIDNEYLAARVFVTYTNAGPVTPVAIFGVSPAALNFGTVNVGSNAILPVTVNNTGTAALNITGLTSSDPQFTFSPSAPVNIPAGGNAVFNVTFTPTANGNQAANLTFTHNAAGSPSVYSVQGIGYTPSPVIGFSPASLSFGSVAIGGNAVLPLTVNNTGDAVLTLTNIVSSNGQYTFAPSAFPVNIAAGGNAVFSVTFTPTGVGTQTANLTFTHNAAGSPSNYSLTGDGFTLAPFFSINPVSLNFGQVSVGGNAVLPVTVTNTGNSPLTLSGVVASDPVYTFSPNTFPINIAAGGNAVFNVTFTPTADGVVNGNLSFTHNAVGSPSTLTLTGEGRTQGGLLKFIQSSRTVYDNRTNIQDTVVLSAYTGQPLKSLQFDILIGNINGFLKWNSVSRGSAIPASNFFFDYQVYPGAIRPDGSHIDTLRVVILGNAGNTIPPNGPDAQILIFSYDVVSISTPSAFTYNSLVRVVGATETPVRNANIEAGPWETITIFNGTVNGLYGDVNLDNQVDLLDILLMIDYILGRTTFNAQQMFQGDIAPWIGTPLPTPDGVINVLDLAVLQNIVVTGLYPNGDPVNRSLGNPLVISELQKLTPGMDAKLTFHLGKNGITVSLESAKKVKGVQIEMNGVASTIPTNTQITSVFNQAMYYQLNDFLRTLTYDGQSLPMDAGEYLLASLPFSLSNPKDIDITKIIVADENNSAMQKVEIEIQYDEEPGIPLDYWLSQNFPNPFNPSTSVQFSIPVDGFVTIKVYDLLGQEIATLFSGDAQMGTYSLNWNGRDNSGNAVSSGSYIYKMTAGDFVQSKKMTFLK